MQHFQGLLFNFKRSFMLCYLHYCTLKSLHLNKKKLSSVALKRVKKRKIRRLKRSLIIFSRIRNLATILPWNSKLSGKFQRFNAVNGSIEMLKNS